MVDVYPERVRAPALRAPRHSCARPDGPVSGTPAGGAAAPGLFPVPARLCALRHCGTAARRRRRRRLRPDARGALLQQPDAQVSRSSLQALYSLLAFHVKAMGPHLPAHNHSVAQATAAAVAAGAPVGLSTQLASAGHVLGEFLKVGVIVRIIPRLQLAHATLRIFWKAKSMHRHRPSPCPRLPTPCLRSSCAPRIPSRPWPAAWCTRSRLPRCKPAWLLRLSASWRTAACSCSSRRCSAGGSRRTCRPLWRCVGARAATIAACVLTAARAGGGTVHASAVGRCARTHTLTRTHSVCDSALSAALLKRRWCPLPHCYELRTNSFRDCSLAMHSASPRVRTNGRGVAITAQQGAQVKRTIRRHGTGRGA